MLTEIIIGVLLVLIYIVYPRRPKGLPPGKWGWPIIGSLPDQKSSFVEQAMNLRKAFGDIVSWRIGSSNYVILFDYKTIKSVFSKAETADRPQFFSMKSTALFKELGIFSSNGLCWSRNRRFALQHLKDLGMGKSSIGTAIQEEAEALVENFKDHLDKPLVLPWSINVVTTNVIWQLVAGKRFDLDDEEITKFNKRVADMLVAFEGGVKWLDLFDWVRPLIPRSIKERLGLMEVYNITKEITDYFQSVINHHVNTLDAENPRDLIDAYLIEMANPQSELIDPGSIENLKIMILNLFVAGSETTASTIRWVLLYMAKYPEVQAKVQEEIDEAIPRDTLPSLQYRDQMQYLEAVINEVKRIAALTPLSVPHSTNQEMQIEGYIIPKNTILSPHILSCHTDPMYWEKPSEFYPEHFLDEGGKCIYKKEGFLPFGLGRRSCIGESLARMELFLIISSLLQNFTFKAADQISTERRKVERLSNTPSGFKLIITKRD